jgi:hypothetical protein
MVRDLFPVRDIPVFFVNASRWLIANAGAYRGIRYSSLWLAYGFQF